MAERPGAAAKLVQKFRGGGERGRRGSAPPSCHCRVLRGTQRRRAVHPAVGRGENTAPPPGPARLPRQLPHPILSRLIPFYPGKERAETSQTPRGAGGEPGSPAAQQSCALVPRLPARPSAGRGGLSRPSPRVSRRGTAGTGGQRQDPRVQQRQQRGRDLALPPPEQMRSRNEEPPRPQAAPSPAARPAASAPLRAAPCRAAPCGGARGALRAAPGAFPGQPHIFRNLPPGAARRGRDRQRGRRNHVGLRDGYNTFYLEKHYITLRDVTWDS